MPIQQALQGIGYSPDYTEACNQLNLFDS